MHYKLRERVAKFRRFSRSFTIMLMSRIADQKMTCVSKKAHGLLFLSYITWFNLKVILAKI